MSRTTKPAALVAALLLLLGLVTGCGGSDSTTGTADKGDNGDTGESTGEPPTNASTEEFCDAFVDLIQQASQAGQDVSDAEAIKLAKQTADKLAGIGTPEGIPPDARAGFELAIERIQSIPDDATREEMDAIADDVTDEQKQDLDVLTNYVTTTCISLPSDLPSS